MKKIRAFAALGLAAFGLASCRQETPLAAAAPNPEVVATVGSHSITRATLEREMKRRGPGATKEAVLENLINFEATLEKVRASGFDREPETAAALERLLVTRYEERELATAESPAIGDDEVRAAYAASPAKFTIPPTVRGGVIFVKSSPKASTGRRAEAAMAAEQLRAQAQSADATAFARLVREHSDDQATRYQAGDTGWLQTGQKNGWEPAIAEALFSLEKPGDCTPVIEAPNGYYIARLAETRAASLKPLAEVSASLRYQLQSEKRERLTASFRERMRSGLEIQINHTALDQPMATAQAASQPPALP